MSQDDPFRHHPNLRPLIKPPEESFFRDFHPDRVRAMAHQNGLPLDWIIDDATRDADRAVAMHGRWDDDLWVFGYGSLMWDPALRFAEVRRACAPGVARRFILCDVNGGRGRPEAPGLMAALDRGAGCHGLVFRIRSEHLQAETFSLWSRERIGEAYQTEFIDVKTDQGAVQALAFLANHAAPSICADLSHEDQVRYCATGEGVLGTSLHYLESLAEHLALFDIRDPEVMRLLDAARAFRAA